jgi:hypothetical protein
MAIVLLPLNPSRLPAMGTAIGVVFDQDVLSGGGP